MKKQIDVQELRKGMYVTELDRPWLGTPFLFQGFEINSDDELAQLRQLCRHVFILEDDHHQQADRLPARPDSNRHEINRRDISVRELPPASVTRQVVDLKKSTKPLPGTHRFVDHQAAIPPGERHIPAQGTPPPVYQDVTPVESEMAYAREIEQGARETLFAILADARLGKSLDTQRARKVVNRMTESILRNPDAMVWLSHLKKKHEYTATHSLRVCVLALVFGRHLGYDRERLNILGIGALLHDIGKLKVPNELLDKPGKLTADEYEIMKSHVPEGLKLLEAQSGIPPAALEVVGRHHERYNGHGYIAGLTGDTIGEFGLVSALADTYDAMTSDRAYHPGLTPVDALKTIYDGRENTFHPWLAEQFIQCIGIYPIGSVVELSTGGVGVVISANRQRRLRPRVALVLSPEKKRYSPAPIIDLMQVTLDTKGNPFEIRAVLPPGTYGINPIEYIPTHH